MRSRNLGIFRQPPDGLGQLARIKRLCDKSIPAMLHKISGSSHV